MDAHGGGGPNSADLREFVRLVELHGAALFRYLLRMVGNRPLAEDLLQDTFTAAYTHRNTFRGSGSAKAWLFTIARNGARNALRDGSRTVTDGEALTRALAALPADARGPEDELLRLELRAEILAALQRLPAARREAVVLRDIEGLSYAEIAAITGSSEGAVRVQVHRARQQLQDLLAPYLCSDETPTEPGPDLEEEHGLPSVREAEA